jgi:hypothetical protein
MAAEYLLAVPWEVYEGLGLAWDTTPFTSICTSTRITVAQLRVHIIHQTFIWHKYINVTEFPGAHMSFTHLAKKTT